ncbi:hypothetical protein RDI58_015127 [Solanum bulbocastanum]|uniref:Uncharacterized protein n=1 Tax=Solanum bulbocastanum TaxID=147425 RepID=A0AAN8TJX5_SOLBU
MLLSRIRKDEIAESNGIEGKGYLVKSMHQGYRYVLTEVRLHALCINNISLDPLTILFPFSVGQYLTLLAQFGSEPLGLEHSTLGLNIQHYLKMSSRTSDALVEINPGRDILS